jgi:hypothetical protein
VKFAPEYVMEVPCRPEFVTLIFPFTGIEFDDRLKLAVGAELTVIGETTDDVVPHAFEATIVA